MATNEEKPVPGGSKRSIRDRITEDMKRALLARHEVKLRITRLLKSEIKYKEIEKGSELSDDEIISVLSSSIKRHRDSIEQFEKAGRADLTAQEKAELEIIWEYMPKQLEEDELYRIVEEAIKEADVSDPSGLGKVMKIVMPEVRGRADGKRVNELVSSKLESMSQ